MTAAIPSRCTLRHAFLGTLAALAAACFASTPRPSAAGSLPTAKPEDVGMSSERLARVNDVVKKAIDAGEVAGVVTLVARRGRIVHFEAQGYADMASKKPMRTDNIFRLASMGKPVTAVAIMMLVEEGKVRLNDQVAQYIPEFKGLTKVAVPKPGGAENAHDLVDVSRPVTVRDMLTHGSGLMSGGLGQRAAGQSAQRAPEDTLATYLPKLGVDTARLSARHAVALQRARRLRRAEPHRRGGVGADVRSIPRQRLFEPLGDEGQRLLLHRAASRARGNRSTHDGPANARAELRTKRSSSVYFSGAGGLATPPRTTCSSRRCC